MTTQPRPPKRSQKIQPPTPPDIITDNKRSFKRLELLGQVLLVNQGGFAQCYKVMDQEKEFAIKVVHKPSLKSSKQRQKLLSEIKIHQQMSHSNIVTFYSCFEDEENVYMVLELCDNKTLVDLIKIRKRLTEDETRFYMFQLFDGIRYMHRKGFIHRDIKLGNLFLDSKMNLKIGDFGLAAEIEHDGQRKKTICGTPNYIAPEILFDTQNGHSFEVDIWSLGVVMYTLLIGKPPFQTKDVKAIYKNIRDNCYDFPDTVELSIEAKECIQALLNSKPEERPSIDDIMEHVFFSFKRPVSIPKIALERIPTKEEMGLNIDRVNSMESSRKEELIDNVLQLKRKESPELIKPVVPNVQKSLHVQPRMDRMNQGWRSPVKIIDQENVPPSPVGRVVPLTRSPTVPVREKRVSILSHSSPGPTSTASPTTIRHVQPLRSHPSPTTASPTNVSRRELQIKTANQVLRTSPETVPRSPLSRVQSNSITKLSKEEPKKKLTHLELLYMNLKKGVDTSLEVQMSNLQITPHPQIFITKWIDYTNKYGLSYQFRDGSIGVYFNDGTSIILSSDGKYLLLM
jgi:serine/threonine protein kinase